MIKAVSTGPDGRQLVLLGLSFGNLDKFRAEPGDTFIHIKGVDLGIPVDIILFSGETEAHCAETIGAGIGPETKVNIDPKLKS